MQRQQKRLNNCANYNTVSRHAAGNKKVKAFALNQRCHSTLIQKFATTTFCLPYLNGALKISFYSQRRVNSKKLVKLVA